MSQLSCRKTVVLLANLNALKHFVKLSGRGHAGYLVQKHEISAGVCRIDVVPRIKHNYGVAFENVCAPNRTYATKFPKKEPKGKKGGKAKVTLTDEEINEVINIETLKEHFSDAVERLKENYIKNLSLRTSAGSIEALTVSYGGDEYPVNQIAQVVRKNPNLLVINMASFPQALTAVLDSLQQSGMNLNPQQEGTTIYVPIPQVTREHREALSKNAKMVFNKTKEELQDIQNKAVRNVKSKKIDFSEDLIFNVQQQIMSMTVSYISQAENIMLQKQAELLGEYVF